MSGFLLRNVFGSSMLDAGYSIHPPTPMKGDRTGDIEQRETSNEYQIQAFGKARNTVQIRVSAAR